MRRVLSQPLLRHGFYVGGKAICTQRLAHLRPNFSFARPQPRDALSFNLYEAGSLWGPIASRDSFAGQLTREFGSPNLPLSPVLNQPHFQRRLTDIYDVHLFIFFSTILSNTSTVTNKFQTAYERKQ